MKYSFLDYIQILMIGRAIWAMKVNWNVTKDPLSHLKMKYLFLYYIQLLMISPAIRCPPSRKNLIFFKVHFWLDQSMPPPLKFLVEYQLFCSKPSFFWSGQNESKEWYAMIETYKNVNIPAEYQLFCTKPSEQGSFFHTSQNESKEL